jgi:hypothetical protein
MTMSPQTHKHDALPPSLRTKASASDGLGSQSASHRAPQHGNGANLWRQTVVISDAFGNSEAFSLGPDGEVWRYQMGRDAASGGRLLSTGLSADVFGAAELPDGRLLVLAAKGNLLRHIIEQPGHQGWSDPQYAPLPLGSDTRVERIDFYKRGGQLHVELTTSTNSNTERPAMQLWLGNWGRDGPVFEQAQHTPLPGIDEAWRRLQN